jgi:hypothetical protein
VVPEHFKGKGVDTFLASGRVESLHILWYQNTPFKNSKMLLCYGRFDSVHSISDRLDAQLLDFHLVVVEEVLA